MEIGELVEDVNDYFYRNYQRYPCGFNNQPLSPLRQRLRQKYFYVLDRTHDAGGEYAALTVMAGIICIVNSLMMKTIVNGGDLGEAVRNGLVDNALGEARKREYEELIRHYFNR